MWGGALVARWVHSPKAKRSIRLPATIQKDMPVTYLLYGDIYSWDNQLSDFLKENKDQDVVIRFNSNGGDAFKGIAIHNLIKSHPRKVTGVIDGMCASAASLMFVGCHERIIAKSGQMLIHNVSSYGYGTKEDLTKQAEDMAKVDDAIIDIYSSVMGEDQKDNIMKLMQEDRFLSAKEAIELGLAQKTETVYLNRSTQLITNEAQSKQQKQIQMEAEEQIKQLKQENEELRAKLDALEVEKINNLVGSVPETFQNGVRELAKVNYSEAVKMAKNVIETLEKGVKNKASVLSQINQSGKNVDDRENWTITDWRKKDPNGLKALKRDDPDKFKELVANG